MTDGDLAPERGPRPRLLLANHHELGPPARPLCALPPHSAPTGLAFEADGEHALLALFGDKRPLTGPAGPPVGRTVVRVHLRTGQLTSPGGASLGLHRPIDVALGPDGGAWVLDFGRYELGESGELDCDGRSGALVRLPAAT